MSVTASVVSMAKLSAVTAIICDLLFALRRSDEMEMLMADLERANEVRIRRNTVH